MENRLEQLGRVMRQEFDLITKNKSIIELLSIKEDVNNITETLALNGLYELAHEIKSDYQFELIK